MDRVTRFNVLAMSGRAVEAAGDVDMLLLDKTGTITYGNRLAAEFDPLPGASRLRGARRGSLRASLRDETPGGTQHRRRWRGAARATERAGASSPAARR